MAELITRIFIAGLLGFLIGMKNKSVYGSPLARLFSIVCMAACLVTITSIEFFKILDLPWVSDPGRISAQVVSALGFLGTGLVWIGRDNKVRGLPTGAGLWVAAILGILIGSGMNLIAVIGFVFLIIVYLLSNKVSSWKYQHEKKNRG